MPVWSPCLLLDPWFWVCDSAGAADYGRPPSLVTRIPVAFSATTSERYEESWATAEYVHARPRICPALQPAQAYPRAGLPGSGAVT